MPKTRPAFLGILMLDTRFPRPVGDVGNPRTFARAGIPVQYRIVRGASPKRIVEEADPMWLQPFMAAAEALVDAGAGLISTSCGFLAAHQHALQAALPVPVVTSSLLQCRGLAHPGIVTIAAASLNDAILRAAGVAHGTPVEGVDPSGEFHRCIMGNEPTMDPTRAARDVSDAARRLVLLHPSVTDIVLECTNMPPYRSAIEAATARPVHDIETLLVRTWRALRPA